MITKQRTLFYFVGDQAFKSLEEAQKSDLLAMMPDKPGPLFMGSGEIADWMLANSAAIVDTLTTTPRSRARARKANGGAKNRKKKQVSAPGDPGTNPAPLKDSQY